MTGALLQLDKRPVLAGILFGLLAYKPQFGLLIPFVLAASGRWRTFAAAAQRSLRWRSSPPSPSASMCGAPFSTP